MNDIYSITTRPRPNFVRDIALLGWRIVLFIDNRDQEPEMMEEVLAKLAVAPRRGSAQA